MNAAEVPEEKPNGEEDGPDVDAEEREPVANVVENAPPTEEETTTEREILLTPSQEALKMKINQPDEKIREAMTRLYAVPSEKLRAWTCWLSLVGDRADEWQWWLRSQVRLAAKMSELLRRAEETSRDDLAKSRNGDAGRTNETIASQTIEEERIEAATVFGVESSARNNGVREAEAGPSPGKNVPTESSDDGGGKVSPPNSGISDKLESINESDPREISVRRKEREVAKESLDNEGQISYEEGFWPIGTRWLPLSRRPNQKLPAEREPDVIPMPEDEDAMRELMKMVRHQGIAYRTLYKHWTEVADQAVKEIVGRRVVPTSQVYQNGEDLPYCFYLEADPGVDYGIEHDEDVLEDDEGRERISHEFKYLYFNLSDEPREVGRR